MNDQSALNPASYDSRKLSIGLQYFINFGVMGIFMPYFNLYCYHIGFSGFQIGTLSALRSVVMVLFPLVWGSLADRFQIRRPIYIACNIAGTAVWVFYIFTTDFWAMLAVTVCFAVFRAPIISFLEAFTMDVLGKEKESYGKIRAWGSASFIGAVLVLGPVIDRYSIEIILILIFIGFLLQSVISFKIPSVIVKKEGFLFHEIGTLFTRRVVLFLVSAFLMLVSHGTYYGFFSIHLENLGYDKIFISTAWALASTSEILVMIRSDKLLKRNRIENILLFSFLAAAIRWFSLFFAVSPSAILFLQIFHALTYGAFHMASILYIDVLTPKSAKTIGQAVNNASSYGLGLMVGFFVNGYLYEIMGPSALFAMSGFVALFGGAVLKVSLMMDGGQNKKEPSNDEGRGIELGQKTG
ncbi:MFS transporter [Thermodesulfobacteriota bacterium]